MRQVFYDVCPRCKGNIAFVPISRIFDTDGAKYGLHLECVDCSWYDPDNFYTLEEVKMLIDSYKKERQE